MEDEKVNTEICDTQPYAAIAKEVLDTCIEQNLELPEVLKAIKKAFVGAALCRIDVLNEENEQLQIKIRRADATVQAIRKA